MSPRAVIGRATLVVCALAPGAGFAGDGQRPPQPPTLDLSSAFSRQGDVSKRATLSQLLRVQSHERPLSYGLAIGWSWLAEGQETGRVITRFDDVDAVALLVHEYLHAAQDREFALGYFGRGTTDAELMRTSFIEGEADLYGTLAGLQMDGIPAGTFDWRGWFRGRLDHTRQRVLNSTSPHTEVRMAMPYVLGGAFMAAAWQRGGPSGINRAYFESPRATVQLMRAIEDLPIDLPAAAPLCTPALDRTMFAPVASETLGAAVFYAFLTRWVILEEDAWQAALSWQADRMWLFSAPGNRTVSLWRVHAPGLRASRVGAELAARTTPPVLVGDDLLDWSSMDPALDQTLQLAFACH